MCAMLSNMIGSEVILDDTVAKCDAASATVNVDERIATLTASLAATVERAERAEAALAERLSVPYVAVIERLLAERHALSQHTHGIYPSCPQCERLGVLNGLLGTDG